MPELHGAFGRVVRLFAPIFGYSLPARLGRDIWRYEGGSVDGKIAARVLPAGDMRATRPSETAQVKLRTDEHGTPAATSAQHSADCAKNNACVGATIADHKDIAPSSSTMAGSARLANPDHPRRAPVMQPIMDSLFS